MQWVMRKRVVFFLLLGILILSGYFYIRIRYQPVFVAGAVADTGTDYRILTYRFFQPHPLHDGHVWIQAQGEPKSEVRQFLFDLDTETVIGELKNTVGFEYSRELGVILALDWLAWNPAEGFSLERFFALFKRRKRPQAVEIKLIPTGGGKTVSLGTLPPRAEGGVLSPDGRYYRVCSSKDGHFLLDLKERRMQELPKAQSWHGGWWSNHELLFFAMQGTIALLDLETGTQTTLLTQQQLTQFLDANSLSIIDTRYYIIMTVWDGDEHQFLLASSKAVTNQKPAPDEKWVIKIDKESKELQLMERTFDYSLTGRWSPDFAWYVYGGGMMEVDENAVYVRNVKTGREQTLVKGDAGTQINSAPWFYKDKIIFIHEKALWKMDWDGGNQRRVFPAVGVE